MDRKKMLQQAQILRNKRSARNSRKTVALNTKGFVKLSTPLPKKAKDVNFNPPAAAEVRRLRAERILEQRKSIQERRDYEPNDALIIRPKRVTKGCAGCGRKTK